MGAGPKLGILAGGGVLPARIIDACRAGGRDFFVIAFEDQTEAEVVADVPHAWVRLGAAGTTVEILRARGVEEIVMAGPIRRPPMAQLVPDLWATKVLARAGIRAMGDDGLLRAIVHELEETEGFRVVGPESLLPEILADEGVYGAVVPDAEARADIDRGVAEAQRIGALDQGQAAVVRHGEVLAVEDANGTDAMLARCAGLGDGGGVLVKVSKPRQEVRADLPAIGADTVRAAAEAGLAGIAVEAGRALVIDRDEVVRAADGAGLFVIGIRLGQGG